MPHPRLLALAAALTLTILGGGAASAGEPTSHWGWVVVRQPARTYDAGPKDHDTSAHTAVSIAHPTTGSYDVTMHGVGASGGTTHLTSMSTAAVCHADAWNASPADEIVSVRCVSLAGAPRDSPFTLAWYQVTTAPGAPGQAYLWANDPTSGYYTPAASYSYNQMGGVNAIVRGDVGRYEVTLGSMAHTGGQPQVTAYGTSTTTCRVSAWGTQGADMRVSVLCRTPAGALVDSAFTLSFGIGNGLLAFDRPIAYLWADRPTTASYRPRAAFRFSDPKVTMVITRPTRGSYVVTLAGAPLGGVAQVTATETGKSRCVVASIRLTGTPQRIGVRCVGPNGKPTDSPFTLSYAH